MAFATLSVDFVARMASFEESMTRAGKSVANLENRFVSMGRTVSGALAGLGVGIGVGGLAAIAKSGIDAADSLNDMSQRLDVSVKDLASFKLAADQSGTSLDSVGAGIARLSKSIGEAEGGNKQLAQALQSLGITARDPKEAFFQLADAVQKTDDPNKRAALLSQVLGKSYGELVPLLSQGSDALRESARQSETFAEAMSRLAPDADKFNDQLALMKINAAGLASELLVKLVPALNDILERMGLVKNLIASGGLFNTIAITAGTDEISTVMRRLKDDIKETQAAIEGEKAKGKDTSPFEEKLRGLNAQLEVLKKNSRDAALALGEQFKNYKVPQTPGKSRGIDLSAADAKAGGSKADPLAELLRSTDIGRLREFDKQVALLNQRFNYGKKDTELYTQAMTKLVETAFDNNFKQFAEDQKFNALVLEDENKTTREWKQNLADLANVDMSRLTDLLSNTSFAKLKRDQEDMILLARAFSEGIKDADGNIRKLSESEYLDAVATRLGLAKDKVAELDTFAKTAAENIQNSFADFLFDPFDKGLKGMAQSFGQTIQRMIANAVAADLTKRLFGDLVQGGSGSGLAGGLLKSVGSLLSFDGGGYTGDGSRSGGIDGKGGFLSVIHPRETVVDHTRGQSVGGGHTINVYVSGGSAPDVRRAAGQGAREALGMLEGARRYG